MVEKPSSPGPRRRLWGWGYEGHGLSAEDERQLAKNLAERFAVSLDEPAAPPTVEDLDLRAPRVAPPRALASMARTDAEARASHTYGKSFRDVVRALARDFSNPPDFVVYPRTEKEILAVLEWCDGNDVIAIPYGGGSSVVGGTECPTDDWRPVVSMDLGHLDRVLEVDSTSRAARIQAGVFGPSLEAQLRPHRLTLRHFPQSFEFSTLGGWIATRSGGHFATLYTHIDEFVESLRVVTPRGEIESRRLPGSGAGPSPDRMFIGSEGILGVITEAWMRLQDRPTIRTSASVTFSAFLDAAECVRAVSQSGLFPSNCRLLDAGEALTSGAGTGKESVLVLGFESADHDPGQRMQRALEICRAHGGNVPEGAGATRRDDASEASPGRDGAVGAWRSAFLSAPYLRDSLTRIGMVCETFETATTWDAFPEFHRSVTTAVQDAIHRVCGTGSVTCRFTHVYPDGPAPYYTVLAPARRGGQLAQWSEIKAAASEALLKQGGTITHHHAVGRDHRPWFDRQRPGPFARALAAAKHELDPNAILNPGVLIEPRRDRGPGVA